MTTPTIGMWADPDAWLETLYGGAELTEAQVPCQHLTIFQNININDTLYVNTA